MLPGRKYELYKTETIYCLIDMQYNPININLITCQYDDSDSRDPLSPGISLTISRTAHIGTNV